MKAKKRYIVIVILLFIFIAACTDSKVTDNTDKPGDETTSISEEEIEKVKKLKLHDVDNVISSVIDDYLKEDDYLTIGRIDFVEDKLLVDSKNQVKKFNNIKMTLDLELDPEKAPIQTKDSMSQSEKEKEFKEFASEKEKELLAYLNNKQPHEFSKIYETNIRYIDKINKLEHSAEMDHLRDDETILALRNEESQVERELLKELFTYTSGDKRDYQINRFGIEDDKLLIEFINYSVEEEELEDLSQEIYKEILGYDDLNKYTANEITELEIIFDNGQVTTFEYEI